MSAIGLEVDPKRYGKLLARTLKRKCWPDLMTLLIEAFEERHYALRASTPHTRLRSLMQEHGLRQRDLLEIFGSRGVASEVINAKRAISKAHAREPAKLFHVSADLFL